MVGMGAKGYILVLFVVSLCGCALHGKHVMEQAEVLLHDGQAEKAYVLLHEVLPHYRQLPAEEKARFGLLYFIALDKTFKSLQPEELIRFSAEYYRRHGQYALLSRSLLYYSRTCQQQQREEEAVTSMAEACHYAPTDDHDLLGKLYCDLATQYRKREEYVEAQAYYKRALQHFELTGHADNQAATINNMGNVFFLTSRYDSADVYYRRALHLAEDSIRISHALKDLADNFYYQDKLDSAMHYIRASLRYPIWSKSYPYHLVTLADIFFDTEQYDSAHYYADKALKCESQNAFVLREVYRLKANLAYAEEKWDLVPDYMQKYQLYDAQCDSIDRKTPSPATLQNLWEAEEKADSRYNGMIVAVFLSLAMMAIGSVLLLRWRKRQHARLLLLKAQELEKRELAIARQDAIAALHRRRDDLRHQLELKRQKLVLQHKGRPVPEEELQVLFNEMLLLNHPDGYARLSRELFGSLDEKLSAYKLRYPQLLYIHLLLLGVDKNDICTVLGYKAGSVERIRGRLARRFGLEGARKLDAFLLSLADEVEQEK